MGEKYTVRKNNRSPDRENPKEERADRVVRECCTAKRGIGRACRGGYK